jgi:hypothetical protein
MGFGSDSCRAQLSDQALRTVAQLEAIEARRDAEEQRRRDAAVEEYASRSMQLAVQQAVQAGSPMHDALVGRRVGRTHRETVQLMAARMDHEDAMAAAREQQEYRRWQEQRTDDSTAHTSQLEFESARQKAYVEEWAPKVAARKQARRDAQKIAEAVVARPSVRGRR